MSSYTNLENITRPENYITGEVVITEDGPNIIQIINSYDNSKKNNKNKENKHLFNEEEMKESILIKIGEDLFYFHYFHQ